MVRPPHLDQLLEIIKYQLHTSNRTLVIPHFVCFLRPVQLEVPDLYGPEDLASHFPRATRSRTDCLMSLEITQALVSQ